MFTKNKKKVLRMTNINFAVMMGFGLIMLFGAKVEGPSTHDRSLMFYAVFSFATGIIYRVYRVSKLRKLKAQLGGSSDEALDAMFANAMQIDTKYQRTFLCGTTIINFRYLRAYDIRNITRFYCLGCVPDSAGTKPTDPDSPIRNRMYNYIIQIRYKGGNRADNLTFNSYYLCNKTLLTLLSLCERAGIDPSIQPAGMHPEVPVSQYLPELRSKMASYN